MDFRQCLVVVVFLWAPAASAVDHYDAVLAITSLREIITSGIKVYTPKSPDPTCTLTDQSACNYRSYASVCVIGDYDVGKTWLINQLFNLKLYSGSQYSTVGFSIKHISDKVGNIVMIDTAGNGISVADPVQQADLEVTELAIESIALDVCDSIMLVVNDMTANGRRYSERVLNRIEMDGRLTEVIMVHNLKQVEETAIYERQMALIGNTNCVVQRVDDGHKIIETRKMFRPVRTVAQLEIHHVALVNNNSPIAAGINIPILNAVRRLLSHVKPRTSFNPIGSIVDSFSKRFDEFYSNYEFVPPEFTRGTPLLKFQGRVSETIVGEDAKADAPAGEGGAPVDEPPVANVKVPCLDSTKGLYNTPLKKALKWGIDFLRNHIPMLDILDPLCEMPMVGELVLDGNRVKFRTNANGDSSDNIDQHIEHVNTAGLNIEVRGTQTGHSISYHFFAAGYSLTKDNVRVIETGNVALPDVTVVFLQLNFHGLPPARKGRYVYNIKNIPQGYVFCSSHTSMDDGILSLYFSLATCQEPSKSPNSTEDQLPIAVSCISLTLPLIISWFLLKVAGWKQSLGFVLSVALGCIVHSVQPAFVARKFTDLLRDFGPEL